MTPLADWLETLRVRLPGEKSWEHVARVLRALHKLSTRNEPERLIDLFCINEPTRAHAKDVAFAPTNCGTVARCILALCGCTHRLVLCPYPGQVIIGWLLQIGQECDALIDCARYPDAWERIGPGDLLLYHGGGNDWHCEIALGSPDIATGVCEHGGGGKADNGILVMPADDIRFNRKRPLAYIIRTDRLLPVE